jgi:nucleotide-binding universal stress UspA family protein
MLGTLLVPLDGSGFAEQALPLATAVARGAGARLHLVQVHTLYALKDPTCSWLPFDPALDALARQQEQAYLNALAERIGAANGGKVAVTTAVVDGLVVDGILSYAAAIHADLIVMTTHGRGTVSRAFLGSVADELIRRAEMPILLVRPESVPAAASTGRVLVALDRSPLSEKLLEPACEIARSLEVGLTLLHALEPLGHPVGSVPCPPAPEDEPRAAEAHVYLTALAERLRGPSFEVQTALRRGHSAAKTILEECAGGFDMVCLTTRGLGGWKRFLFGSVADKIVRCANIPVLVWHPPAEPAAQVSSGQ